MSDAVNLVVPADERFRALGAEVGGRYVVAAGGSEADAGTLASALTAAVDEVAAGAGLGAGVELDFRSPNGAVEVTVRCHGKSSVITHPLPASQG